MQVDCFPICGRSMQTEASLSEGELTEVGDTCVGPMRDNIMVRLGTESLNAVARLLF